MEIVETAAAPSQVRLREEFLAPYRRKVDPFESLLARSTYLTKYCRDNETWTDTIRRVVEGNATLAPGVSEAEMEMLFHLFWTGQALPPGRGLWTGGVPGIPADARFNCWFTTLYGIDDWCWTANQLMLGGGVGVGLSDIGSFPPVSGRKGRFAIWCREDHPNFFEVAPEGPMYLNGCTPRYVCEDSREGWVEALRRVLTAAFRGEDLVVDVSNVRSRGLPIKTFGGTACGPAPLAQLLRATWSIVRGAAGRRLNSVEALDITNHIGLCIKAGNVRRSALIVLGQAQDKGFRDAKKDWQAVTSHRHTSNNSIAFHSWDQLANFNWDELVDDNIEFGEPGILNLPLGRKTDPGVKGVNPCFSGDTRIAVADGRNSVTIRQLAEEGKDVPVYSMDKVTGKVQIKMGRHPRITGYGEKLVRVWLDDGSYLDTTPKHKFILLDGSEVQAQALKHGDSLPRFTKTLERVKKGSKDYYLIHCNTRNSNADRLFEHRLIARFQAMLEQGHGSRVRDGQVLVTKTCELCGSAFGVANAYRELSFCSEACENAYINSNAEVKAKRCAGMDAVYSGRMEKTKVEQARICSALKFQLGRNPNRKEWSLACKKEAIPSRIGPTLKFGFKQFKEVLEAASDYNHKVVRVEELAGEHTVYNITVDDFHTVAVVTGLRKKRGQCRYIGVITGNCGEVLLHDREACNLAEVFPAKFDVGTDPVTVFRLVTRYCLRQRLTRLTDPKADEVQRKTMRLGVGLGGICDFDWTPELLAKWYGVCRREADSYADELDVSRPIAVSTVKPSGTISLLNSSDPGLHAAHSRHYLRRVRIAKNDPMAPAMMEAGVPYEEDHYDQTGHTWVFAFPTRSESRVTKDNETLRGQFERQATVQEWWSDNAVSATISFDPKTERKELASCFKEFTPRLKSTSVLGKKNGYVQAPYEAIDEATYREAASKIDHGSKLIRGGDIEVESCENGVCPIR